MLILPDGTPLNNFCTFLEFLSIYQSMDQSYYGTVMGSSIFCVQCAAHCHLCTFVHNLCTIFPTFLEHVCTGCPRNKYLGLDGYISITTDYFRVQFAFLGFLQHNNSFLKKIFFNFKILIFNF